MCWKNYRLQRGVVPHMGAHTLLLSGVEVSASLAACHPRFTLHSFFRAAGK